MRVRILGGGWYGCHLAVALLKWGYEVELAEKALSLFAGASGANPARLHLGFHYPRSKVTRALCQEQHAEFMNVYGHFTRTIPTNVYAIAEDDSKVDWGTYCQVLRGEVDFIPLECPSDMGFQHLEGAMLTGERHIVISQVRQHFDYILARHKVLGGACVETDRAFDLVIDCTFAAQDPLGIDRYEACVTGLLKGPTNMAVTIMDGPFPSIYPWDEAENLCSLTSASLTPMAGYKTYDEAQAFLRNVSEDFLIVQCREMIRQMQNYWPECEDRFELFGYKTAVRAMPRSGADSRIVDFVELPKHSGEDTRRLRVRAGKIDAILYAEKLLKEFLKC